MKTIVETLKKLREAIVHKQQVELFRQFGEEVKEGIREKIAELEIDPMGYYLSSPSRERYNEAIADAHEAVKNVIIK